MSVTVRFVLSVDTTSNQPALADKHKAAITAALKASKKTKRWSIGSDISLNNSNLGEALQEVLHQHEHNANVRYIFLTDGHRYNSLIVRAVRTWPKDSSRVMVVIVSEEALLHSNDTRNRLGSGAASGSPLSAVAAREGGDTLSARDLETIVTHLSK